MPHRREMGAVIAAKLLPEGDVHKITFVVSSLLLLPESGSHQQAPGLNLVRVIHLQDANSHTPNGCLSEDICSIPLEMVVPHLSSGIKKWRQQPGLGIVGRYISTLVEIALKTSPGVIFEGICPAMFLGYDMIQVVTMTAVAFRLAAIFAATDCPPSYLLPYSG